MRPKIGTDTHVKHFFDKKALPDANLSASFVRGNKQTSVKLRAIDRQSLRRPNRGGVEKPFLFWTIENAEKLAQHENCFRAPGLLQPQCSHEQNLHRAPTLSNFQADRIKLCATSFGNSELQMLEICVLLIYREHQSAWPALPYHLHYCLKLSDSKRCESFTWQTISQKVKDA